MSANLNFEDKIESIKDRMSSLEQPLGKELIQPFPTSSSGSRKIMFSTHSEQALALCNGEVPFIQTGFENEFGKHSTSFKVSDEELEILERVEKYSAVPGHEYYLIVYRKETDELDVIHKCDYKYITESFGYQINNDYLNSLTKGSVIPKNTVYSKSKGFDEYNNRMDGINTLVMYVSQNKTIEDAIQISESCAKKFRSPLVKKISFMINENDILLNLYGDETVYRVIPDIGESVHEGILAAVRRENKDESLYSQVFSKLRDITMSDEKITSEGVVVGIDIRTNNPGLMESSSYMTQLNYYHQDSNRFYNEIIQKVERLLLLHECKLSYELQKILYTGKQILDGVKFKMDKNVYSNLQMDIYILEERELHIGDKLTNRYGGKGVISSIVPDHLMPQTEDGRYVEMKYNQATVVNRLNPSQLFEMEINSASAAILRNLDTDDVSGSFRKIIKFINFFSPMQAKATEKYLSTLNRTDKSEYLKSIIADGNITLSILPVTEATSIDVLREVLHEFPETRHGRIRVPMKDSNGNYRMITPKRPVLVAKQYIYRLKQYAEEKFSATSMSFSNNRGENSRNKSSGLYKPVYTNTPIRQGEMEIGALTHIGDDINVIMLMLYSSAPIGRRVVKDLLTKSPTNIDVVLTDDARSRSAEIVKTYMKAIGLQLVFEKRKRDLIRVFPNSDLLKFDVPVFYKGEEYLKQMEEFRNSEYKIVHKEINGKIYPVYEGLKQPLTPVFMTKVFVPAKDHMPEEYDEYDPLWIFKTNPIFNGEREKQEKEKKE